MDGQEKNVANDIQQLGDYCIAPWIIIPDMRIAQFPMYTLVKCFSLCGAK